MLDKFDEEDKLKYRHLEKLEARKKFDVKELKSKIENQEKYRENDWSVSWIINSIRTTSVKLIQRFIKSLKCNYAYLL